MAALARLPILPYDEPCVDVPAVRAGFDRLDRCWPLTVELEGWLLSPQTEFDSIEVYLNGRVLGAAERVQREDVRDTFPWIRHAQGAGFRVPIDPYRLAPRALNHLDLISYRRGIAAGHVHTLFRPDLEDVTPTPPPVLMERVAGHQEAMSFKLVGLKCFGDFYRAIHKHGLFTPGRRLLDWGCGCGRVTAHFLLQEHGPKVFGCDIDREAIAWCQDNLPPGEFMPVATAPPTPYPDGFFDVIVGYSVFTHLTRSAQAAWLAELKRLLAPGGIVIATVHGAYAAAFEWPPDEVGRLLQGGIHDQNPDASLSGVVEEGYYQNTFQTRDYTLQEWSRFLEIVEYVEAGMNSYQDMVILRRQ
jgi:SAM-dependent methyltransferase